MESFSVLNKNVLILSVLYGEILVVELSEAFFFNSRPSIYCSLLLIGGGRVESCSQSQQAPFNRLYKKIINGFTAELRAVSLFYEASLFCKS